MPCVCACFYRAAELPELPSDAFFGKVRVIVMNTKPARHDVFDRVRRRFQGSRVAAAHLRFVDHPGTYGEATTQPTQPNPSSVSLVPCTQYKKVRFRGLGV